MRESGIRGFTAFRALSKCLASTCWALMSSCRARRAASLHTAVIWDRKQTQIFGCQARAVHPLNTTESCERRLIHLSDATAEWELCLWSWKRTFIYLSQGNAFMWRTLKGLQRRGTHTNQTVCDPYNHISVLNTSKWQKSLTTVPALEQEFIQCVLKVFIKKLLITAKD